MHIKYDWRVSEAWNDGILRPRCTCDDASDNFKGLVFSFLNDDEGHGLEYLTNWIDEGLNEVEKINDGKLDYYDMWGHAWGADITRNKVLIYWGYDDSKYEENMSFECFYKILKEWCKFIKTEPSLDYKVEFECQIISNNRKILWRKRCLIQLSTSLTSSFLTLFLGLKTGF